MRKKITIGLMVVTASVAALMGSFLPLFTTAVVRDGGPPMTPERYNEVLRDIESKSGDYNLLCTRKLQIGRFKEALKDSDILSSRDVRIGAVGLSSELRASALERLSRIDEAILEITKAIKHCQTHNLSTNSLYLYRASLFFVSGQIEKCVDDLSKMESHGPEYQVLLSHCALMQGEKNKALQIANALLAANPSYSPGLYVRAQILTSLGQNDKAIADYNWLLNRTTPFDGYLRPSVSMILRLRASNAYRLADYDQAANDLTLAQQIDAPLSPIDGTFNPLKILCLERLGKYKEAIEQCDLEVSKLQGQLAQTIVLRQRISVLAETNKTEQAVK